MSENKYKHTYKSCRKWLKERKAFLQGVLSGVLVSIFAFMVCDDLTNAYILLHMKEPENIVILDTHMVAVDTRVESSSSSSAASQEPVREASSSSETSLRPAAPDISSEASSASATSESSTSSSSTRNESSVSSEQSSSSSSISSVSPATDFPAFDYAVMPVWKVPNWGNMRTPEEWNRTYGESEADDFVPLPAYSIRDLTSKTMQELQETRNEPATIALLTEKLAYSTRYFGAYDLDATEFTGIHPGIDIKLAEGTPIAAIGGGKVHLVRNKSTGLGMHVIIEHRLDNGSRYFSIYGHLASVSVSDGDIVKPGQVIGRVGMTGKTTAPHLHLQIDVGTGEDVHTPYMPDHLPSRTEAARFVINPIQFIAEHLR